MSLAHNKALDKMSRPLHFALLLVQAHPTLSQLKAVPMLLISLVDSCFLQVVLIHSRSVVTVSSSILQLVNLHSWD